MANTQLINWLNSITWQVDFCLRSGRARRRDPEFEWATYERTLAGRFPEMRRWATQILHGMGLRKRPPMSLDWLRENATLLWETREMLADELSRLLFDSALVVRLTSHRRYYFPRIDFDDLIEIVSQEAFIDGELPQDYLGMPLGVFDVRLRTGRSTPPLKVVTREIQLRLVNSYRQYLIRRGGFDFSPVPGDVVFDCGACIGEIALLFAGLAAPGGEVHLFDPVPLHTRFCQRQSLLNPAYSGMLHINTLAVGDRTHAAEAPVADSGKITPGAVNTNAYACTTLDDYVKAKKLERVDFIKMDIEGSELAALAGAAKVIADFRPRLAISGYHKPEDLWELPQKLMTLNPNYTLAFGHHTPIVWETVFYAVDRAALARSKEAA